jgi:hypothetical protein
VRYDTDRLAASYEAVIRSNMERMYIATEGFPWDDGPYIGIGGLVEDRLGGAPVRRGNQFPEHVISWRFAEPHDGTSIAALVPGPTRESVTVIVYNLQPDPVTAEITGWGVEPGTWEIVEGVDANGDDVPDTGFAKRTAAFERSTGVMFTFPPRQTYAIRMTLKKKGEPYWKRPDLGIGADGAVLDTGRNTVTVTVHNTGSLRTPETTIGIAGADGRVVATSSVPAIEPPTDYRLKAATVTVSLPAGTERDGLKAVIDPDGKLTEITRKNNEAAVR